MKLFIHPSSSQNFPVSHTIPTSTTETVHMEVIRKLMDVLLFSVFFKQK